MSDTSIKETFALVSRSGILISGYGKLATVRKFQKSWLENGHPAKLFNNCGWVHKGCTYGGRTKDLIDTHIIKRTEIIVEQVVPGSAKHRRSK